MAKKPSTSLQLASDASIVIKRSISDQWPDIAAAIEQLIRSRRSENTRIAYASDWQKWCEFVANSALDLKAPGLAATTAFRDELIQRHSSATVKRVLGTLAFFYMAMRDAGLIHVNPFTSAWLPRPVVSDQHKTPAVEDDAVRRLLQSLETDRSKLARRDEAFVRILYDTGLRRASVVGLRRDQFRKDGAGLVTTVIVKGGAERVIKLTQDSVTALGAWLRVAPPSPFVFPKRGAPDEPMALATLNYMLKARAKEAGISDAIAPHQFRAAFITTAFDAGLNERDIQVAAHHQYANTTRGYDRGARGDAVVDAVADFRRKRAEEAPIPPPIEAPAPIAPRRTKASSSTFAEIQEEALRARCAHCGATAGIRCSGPSTHRCRILAALKRLRSKS